MKSKILLVLVFCSTMLSGCSSSPNQAVMSPMVARSEGTVQTVEASNARFAPANNAIVSEVESPSNNSRGYLTAAPEPNAYLITSPNATPVSFSNTGGNQAAVIDAALRRAGRPDPAEDLRQSLHVRPEYTMGPGDVLVISVLGDDKVSGIYTIGPDGKIGVPIAGVVMLAGLTREQAADTLAKALVKKIENPSIAINITQYNNNHVYVLGRVVHPGQLELSGEGRLLQALAAAGIQNTERNLPTSQNKFLPPRCAIIRGNQQAIWIDLQRLLAGGDLSLNVALNNNDLIFLPEVEEEYVYVMGAVGRPGAVPFRPKMSLIDALSVAGGIINDGRYNDVIVSRRQPDGEFGPPQEYDVRRAMEKGQSTCSMELNAGDVVFVRRSNMAKVGLFFQRIGPGIQLMSVGSNVFGTIYGSNNNQTTTLSTGGGTTPGGQAPAAAPATLPAP